MSNDKTYDIILIDERIDRIDKKMTKASFACVEINEDDLNRAIELLTEIVIDDNLRFPKNGNKLHFSELNDAQKGTIIEVLCKMTLKAKTYTYYFFNSSEKDAKKEGLSRTVKHIRWLHRNITPNIYIESADEYRGLKIDAEMKKSSIEFLLPDAVLSIYAKHLNEISDSSTASNAQFYSLLKEKIRLQAFFFDKSEEFNTREKRI